MSILSQILTQFREEVAFSDSLLGMLLGKASCSTVIHQTRMTTTHKLCLVCNTVSVCIGLLLFVLLVNMILLLLIQSKSSDYFNQLKDNGEIYQTIIIDKQIKRSSSMVDKIIFGEYQYFIGYFLTHSNKTIWEMAASDDYQQLHLNQSVTVYHTESQHFIKERRFISVVVIHHHNYSILVILILSWLGIRRLRYSL